MKRKSGYYWVRRSKDRKCKIAHWKYNNWYLTGCELVFKDSDFCLIIETPIKRNV